MAKNVTVIRRIIPPSGEVANTPQVISCDAVDERSVAFSNTDQQILASFKFANLKVFHAIADAACHLYSNAASGGAPDDTIALAANAPYQWVTGDGATNPFSNADVTTLYGKKDAAGTVNVTIIIGHDSTP